MLEMSIKKRLTSENCILVFLCVVKTSFANQIYALICDRIRSIVSNRHYFEKCRPLFIGTVYSVGRSPTNDFRKAKLSERGTKCREEKETCLFSYCCDIFAAHSQLAQQTAVDTFQNNGGSKRSIAFDRKSMHIFGSQMRF